MEQHAVPRQITTFEFKLIGFLTLKQFGYLVVFACFAVITYFLFPIPLLNYLLAFSVFGIGGFFAFFKHNERSIDVWIKNLIVRLLSPSQYKYQKSNSPPDFLKNVFIQSSPATIAAHIDARQKLSSYVSPQVKSFDDTKKQHVQDLIHAPTPDVPTKDTLPPPTQEAPPPLEEKSVNKPFIIGTIRNNKEIPLPNIMVYIKDQAGKNVRMLKTNSHGVFATFHPLPEKPYVFEVKDLEGRFFFDTMNVDIRQAVQKPLAIYSKELL